MTKREKIMLIIILVLIITLILILNTNYEITFDNVTYKQKIIYFLLGID